MEMVVSDAGLLQVLLGGAGDIPFCELNSKLGPVRHKENQTPAEKTQKLRRVPCSVSLARCPSPICSLAPAAARPAPPSPGSKHLTQGNRALMRPAGLVLFTLIPAKSFVRRPMSIPSLGWPAKRRRVSSASLGGVKDEPRKGRCEQRQSASVEVLTKALSCNIFRAIFFNHGVKLRAPAAGGSCEQQLRTT